MSKRKTNITTLFIISIMALAGIGSSYALWYGELHVSGYIETAEMCWEITSVGISDPTGMIDQQCDDGFLNIVSTGKDVGSMTYTISGDAQTLTVTFDNVYPHYYGHVYFIVHNCGDIAWHMDHVNLYWEGVYVGTMTSQAIWSFGDDYEMRYMDNFGAQVHPCESISMEFDIHIFQLAEMATTYNFALEPVCIQYNEPWTGPYYPPP